MLIERFRCDSAQFFWKNLDNIIFLFYNNISTIYDKVVY